MNLPYRSKRQRAKLLLRQLAIGMCGGLLRIGSRPLPTREDTTVVIAPHQDDESLGCGGIIARRRNEGLPVHVIFITDGSASHPDHERIKPAELAHLRRAEAMAAMKCLGVERNAVHFLDEPDGTLKDISQVRRRDLVGRLGTLLAQIQPAEIFLPCNPDGSGEHVATFAFVIDAVRARNLTPEIWQYPVWSWWNPGLMFRRWVKSPDCRRQPLEDYLQWKQHAIACYQSQVAPLPPDRYASLPPELVRVFHQDTEFFFRYELPPRQP